MPLDFAPSCTLILLPSQRRSISSSSRGPAVRCTSSSLSRREILLAIAAWAHFSKVAGLGGRTEQATELLGAESHSGEICVQMTAFCARDWRRALASLGEVSKGRKLMHMQQGVDAKRCECGGEQGTRGQHNMTHHGQLTARVGHWLQCDGSQLQALANNHREMGVGRRGWLRVFTRQPCTTADPPSTPPLRRANETVGRQRQATPPSPSTTPASRSSAGRHSIDCNPLRLPCNLPAMQLHKQSMAPGRSETSSELRVVRVQPICRSVSPSQPAIR